MMVEHERAYIFTEDDLTQFIEDKGLNLTHQCNIEDFYLSQDCRLRCERRPDEEQWLLVRKEGCKSNGHRFEQEEHITEDVAKMLIPQSKLHVIKQRDAVEGNFNETKSYKITVDFVKQPLKVAILEVEANDPISIPIPLDISRRLFGADLRSCPLCAWKYFKRKVGICGGPSSGKTSTAQWLSFQLNTRFGGNSFHVAEYATTFIQKYDRHPAFSDQILVWFGQWKRELNARKANMVISDCPTFLSYIYAKLLHVGPFNEKDALQLAKIYKQCLFDVNSYSDIILMEMQGYVDNNIRNEGEEVACYIHERIQRFLDDHNISYQSRSYFDNEKTLKDLLYLN